MKNYYWVKWNKKWRAMQLCENSDELKLYLTVKGEEVKRELRIIKMSNKEIDILLKLTKMEGE